MTRINTNVGSLIGRNNLANANASLSESLTRLSTGLRINTGADDPAGLIASENLRSDITSINAAISNTERAEQVIATADSALGQVSSLLNDIRGLVTESANAGALSDEQILANQLQVDSSLEALNRIAQTTTFQGRRLLDGSLDFLTSSADADFANVSNLQIDQANLGATGAVAVDIEVTTAATQAQIDVENIPAGSALSTATAGLDFTLNQAAVNSSVTGGGSFAVDVAATTATGNFALTNGSFDISAAAAGSAGNNTNINVVISDTTTSPGTAVFNGTDTITVALDITNDAANSTIADAATAINNLAGFTTSNVVGGTGVAVASESTTGGALAGGANAQVDAAATLTATNTAGANFDITFASGASGSNIVVGGDTTNGVTVTIGDDFTGTLGSISAAINANVSDVADASFGANESLVFDAAEGDNTGIANVVNLTGGTAAGAVGTLALDVATLANTAEFNADTFNVTEITNPGDATDNTVVAAVDDANGEIDLTITGTVTGQAIVDAINGLTDGDGAQIFTATLDTVNSTGGFSLAGTSFAEGTDSVAGSTTAFAGGSSGGGLANDVVFELGGADGAEVLSFGAGTSIADLVAGIELVSDATGVTANANGTTLELISSNYGTDAFVDISVIEDGAALFTDDRDSGSDIVANVNGVSATGNGNELSINTATLDLSATIDPTFTGTASFNITGGGALFQLGPDVVSNQQARLGIGSVNTARLGGVSGNLFQLGTGGSADLSTDANTAATIVEEAIDQVTSLRGRLGAFQRTTLETNRSALNDTLTNLADAESSIRDADFAVETANLTRSQILVQSSTQVLAIANQNPQNVLALLG